MTVTETDLTFFVWADTHFGYETRFNEKDLRGNIIAQMNNLPGWPFPADIGGCVARPEFVVLCGDAVEDAPGQAELEYNYYQYFIKKLSYPCYEVVGNHDLARPYMQYFIEKHGGRSYSFECRNIHFISLNSDYDEGEKGSVAQEDLAWLQKELGTINKSVPVVLFLHTRIDSLKNPDEVLKILADSHVVLVVSAHKHIPDVFELEGISCISVGHCRNHPIDPEYGRHFYVIHIIDNRIVAVPWRWDLRDWEQGQRWETPTAQAATAQRFLLNTEF